MTLQRIVQHRRIIAFRLSIHARRAMTASSSASRSCRVGRFRSARPESADSELRLVWRRHVRHRKTCAAQLEGCSTRRRRLVHQFVFQWRKNVSVRASWNRTPHTARVVYKETILSDPHAAGQRLVAESSRSTSEHSLTFLFHLRCLQRLIYVAIIWRDLIGSASCPHCQPRTLVLPRGPKGPMGVGAAARAWRRHWIIRLADWAGGREDVFGRGGRRLLLSHVCSTFFESWLRQGFSSWLHSVV